MIIKTPVPRTLSESFGCSALPSQSQSQPSDTNGDIKNNGDIEKNADNGGNVNNVYNDDNVETCDIYNDTILPSFSNHRTCHLMTILMMMILTMMTTARMIAFVMVIVIFIAIAIASVRHRH